MQVTVNEINNIKVIRLTGSLSLDPDDKSFDELIEEYRKNPHNLIINLSEVSQMNSMGISALGVLDAHLGELDRALKVVAPKGPVKLLFDTVGISRLIDVYESEEDAIAAFAD